MTKKAAIGKHLSPENWRGALKILKGYVPTIMGFVAFDEEIFVEVLRGEYKVHDPRARRGRLNELVKRGLLVRIPTGRTNQERGRSRPECLYFGVDGGRIEDLVEYVHGMSIGKLHRMVKREYLSNKKETAQETLERLLRKKTDEGTVQQKLEELRDAEVIESEDGEVAVEGE